MTFSEFAGVKCADIDVETGNRMANRDIYRRVIQRLGGLEKVKPFIPFSLEQIQKAIPKDEHLNNLPIREWDRAAGWLWVLYRKNDIRSASLSQGVCLLKEAAREWYEEETEK